MHYYLDLSKPMHASNPLSVKCIPIDLFTLYDRLLGLKCVLVYVNFFYSTPVPHNKGSISQGFFFTFQAERPDDLIMGCGCVATY